MYYQQKPSINNNAVIMNEMREIFQEKSFYGYRRIEVELRKNGFVVNHKKVRILMRLAGLKTTYPGKKTTIRNLEHKVFPYLLKEIKVEQPNQVWQVDITYIKIRYGYIYLVCLIDVFSRKIMGRNISPFLDTASCIEALNNALKHAIPEIVNSDQGCQFTSAAWVDLLIQNGIAISMDGKGRWADNVYIERFWRTLKYENVFLHSFDSVEEAEIALDAFIKFYNQERFHQALNYHTPDAIYALGTIPTKQQLFEQFRLQNSTNLGVSMFRN